MLRFVEFAIELRVTERELNCLQQVLEETKDDPPFLMSKAHDDCVILYADNSLTTDIDRVCNVLQAFVKHFDCEPILLSWAEYSNRPIIGEFGGGAAAISKNEIQKFHTKDWLQNYEKNM